MLLHCLCLRSSAPVVGWALLCALCATGAPRLWGGQAAAAPPPSVAQALRASAAPAAPPMPPPASGGGACPPPPGGGTCIRFLWRGRGGALRQSQLSTRTFIK